MLQFKNCTVTDTIGSTEKLLNEVYLLPSFAFPSCLTEGLRWLTERQNKNPFWCYLLHWRGSLTGIVSLTRVKCEENTSVPVRLGFVTALCPKPGQRAQGTGPSLGPRRSPQPLRLPPLHLSFEPLC